MRSLALTKRVSTRLSGRKHFHWWFGHLLGISSGADQPEGARRFGSRRRSYRTRKGSLVEFLHELCAGLLSTCSGSGSLGRYVFVGGVMERCVCSSRLTLGCLDFIDPCSGLPMLTLNCNKVYSEVDGMECCLGYKSYSAGFCKILTHPAWGSAVYPATIFVHAPRDFIMQLLESYPEA